MYLSVIISAWNESTNLKAGVLTPLFAYLKKQEYAWELLLVNDGSDDDTSQILHELENKNIKVIDNPHMGKAAGIITGVEKAQGDIILFCDVDQSTPISEFDKFLPKFESGIDLVIGSRSGRKGAPLFRQVLAYGQILLRTLILRLPYKDTQCGFKAFKRESANKIFGLLKQIHPFEVVEGGVVNPGFDVELLYLGRKLGYKIAEVPVEWHHVRSERVRFLRDAIAGVKELLLVRWRALTNEYKL